MPLTEPMTAASGLERTSVVETAPSPARHRWRELRRSAPTTGEMRRRAKMTRRVAALVPPAAAYLALAVVLWWHVWSAQPNATATCGCGDPALFLWFLEWPAYAIAHGHNPFFSTALFHPGGINLLSNTSVLAIGIPLAPVTWLFGPVATLNVAATLAPALSSLAAFWVLRRWEHWSPAAFLGGLLYGFSPFVLSSLQFAHLMTAALVVPPLMLACLDELLVRQQRSPVAMGLLLGLLAVVQFFVSTEMTVIVAIASVIGLVVLVLFRAVTEPADLVRRARAGLVGLAVAAVCAGVLLAYPAWYALAGPAHLSGALWPDIPVIGGYTLRSFVDASTGTGPTIYWEMGGYFGKNLPSSAYLGWGLLAVLVVGTAVWWRDRRLWFFGVLGLVTGALTLGVRRHQWVPWDLLGRWPLLSNVIEQRFVAITYLALAVMLAVIVDRVRLAVRAAAGARDRPIDPGPAGSGRSRHGRRRRPSHLGAGLLGAGAALAVAAVALVPIGWATGSVLPFATRPVGVPAWFATAGTRLSPGRVLLAYPAPFSGIQSAMAWQAIDGMDFAQAGGGGPQGTAGRAGAERAGFEVLTALGFGFTATPTGTPAQLEAVRAALAGWRVNEVVIPDQPGLPPVLRGHDPGYAAGFMTAVLGRRPQVAHDAWVWPQVVLSSPSLRLGRLTLLGCARSAERRHLPLEAVPDCVLRQGHPTSTVAGLASHRDGPAGVPPADSSPARLATVAG
jgi:hypothetical protein